MAALSVQRDNGGIMTFTSGSFASAAFNVFPTSTSMTLA
ncbi:hypothetical protein CGLO_14501 [Colletotrichum gloeosporioides Cg-14]|uniref:Uncharacterized protein n=1 Tax=Colletotrichum gloeosporioides (strain Cg-14) TaxID=1237896 RepID=T0K3V9_COLGC|nr:hypothetical protein CGLO_14501 [Colletotrichum gloeosporioides Cg-14]